MYFNIVRLFISVVFAGLSFAGLAFSQETIKGYESLMAVRQKIQHVSADYTETRYVSFLPTPIRIEGQLEFIADGYLKKTIIHPESDILEIDKGEIIHTDKNGVVQIFNSDINPVLHVSTAGLLAVLSGDKEKLDQLFDVTFGIEKTGWLLHLRPKDSRVKMDLLAIRVLGTEAEPTRIEFFEASGDRSFMQISPTLTEWKND